MEGISTNSLADRVAAEIRAYEMILPGEAVLVGLSGGPDSVCLMSILSELREILSIRALHAVHVNHGLRGEDSMRDEEYAGYIAQKYGATFDALHCDVAAIAGEQGVGTELAGRRVRYEYFERKRIEYGAEKIAVAHNRNDQAETVLMRILRGTGIRGLAGIEPVNRERHLIRPLYDIPRSEIEKYCAERGLRPQIDKTNLQPVYTRNRIRLQLLPALEQEYNPRLQDALVRLGENAAEADDFIKEAALAYLRGDTDPLNRPANADSVKGVVGSVESLDGEACFKEAAAPHPSSPGSVSQLFHRLIPEYEALRLDGFGRLHPAVAKRVLLICAERIGLDHNITSDALGRMLRAAESDSSREEDVVTGWFVRQERGLLWFLRRDDPASGRDLAPVPVLLHQWQEGTESDVMYEYGGRRIHLQCIPAGETGSRILREKEWKRAQQEQDLVAASLDAHRADALSPLFFRTRRPGDRFRPMGMSGSKKLQDYFTDRKIPRSLRDRMILLAGSGRILLAGSEVSGDAAVTEESSLILRIWYRDGGGNG